MKVVIVHNPRSGSALPLPALKAKFHRAGITVIDSINITSDFKKAVQPYTDQRETVIVGYGGDGTLSSIAAELHGKKALFAPLPGGTLNHFTKDLGIEQDIDIAIRNLKKAKLHAIDTASVNDQLFLNNSSIGLYPTSLAERSRIESILGKWPAAAIASIRAFIAFRTYSVSIANKMYRTPFIFIGNNDYDIRNFMTRSSLESGKLCIYIIDSTKRLVLLKAACLSLIGRSTSLTELTKLEATTITIKVNRRHVRVSFDGEHQRLLTPLSYKIQQGSLNVLL